ncbi:IPT/TIG domain-containing protein [Embleya sp. NPDC050154]|uniref:IPT/TIG domain-containing protein n=1 Tax=Embleya sp. NPDC050154 TaxID=3363988 RepID=UPI0037A998CD
MSLRSVFHGHEPNRRRRRSADAPDTRHVHRTRHPYGPHRLRNPRRPIALIAAVTLFLACLVAQAAPASAARPGVSAYVANSGSNTVSVIDTANNTTTATIPVGSGPYGLAANHAGTRVYVANFGSAGVSVIDTATDTVTGTIATAGAPFAMAVDPTDTRLYVAQNNSVLVVDLATNTPTATIAVGTNPIAVLVAPDGAHVYAVNNAGHNVSVIDTATAGVGATIALGGSPDGAALSPDGRRLYAVDDQSGLWVLDLTAGGALAATVPIAEGSNVAVNAAGTRAYVSAFPAAVKVVDLTTNTVIDSVAVGSYPANLTLHVAGGFVYTTNAVSGDVSVIDTASDTVVATIPVGNTPYGIVVVGVPQPRTVTSVTPGSGPAAGGTAVTVTGTGFTGTTAVAFGATPAPSYTVVDDTTITATAPPGTPGTVDVTVTGPGGTSATTPADRFTYLAAPTVTSISPGSGPAAGGTVVTITGTNLAGATGITFGPGRPAGSVSCTATTCTATAPPGPAGSVDVQVSTPGGTSATGPGDRYTYIASAADVAVTLRATGVPSLFNARIDYTVTITNRGPDALGSATVTAPLPVPMTVTSPDCSVANRTVTCTVGPLAGNAATTRHFTAPVALLSLGAEYEVTASRVASTPNDPNPANNSSSASCTAVTSLLIFCS